MPQNTIAPTTTRNVLLRDLPDSELQLIGPHLELVQMKLGMVVCDPNEPPEYVYFPEDGIVSSVSVMADGSAVETATIGHEGMSSIAVFHGVERTAQHLFVQVPGMGQRLRATTFREIIGDMPVLGSRLSKYTVALMTLIAQNSGCNRKHTMIQRCARWLSLTHDQVGKNRFELTHHILSQMLGVRRASVTEAALVLQQANAIEYSRGVVTILDRTKLTSFACECYPIVRSTFQRLFEGGDVHDPLDQVSVSEDGMSTAGDGTPSPENEPPR
jgi:CRP-like cAMP-binding protein